MLTCPHRPPDVTPPLPPISTLTTPYAPTVPSRDTSNASHNPPTALHRLPCLHLCSALLTCLQCFPQRCLPP
ncbi:hypothetical protein O181_131744 [Austropuccinia psidii MF-1]|uniref:Uncharacterized protein n=1 Tax=Austropuccinia psidii MF-1 TaxID=1389203 RepID=A0A9Q3L685_9BASI|nr:hypothetical protein [Austropuccinia psidii MF-1]